MDVHLMQQLQQYREIFELIEKDSILQIVVLSTVLFVGCWWGFALYIYLRRGYFRP